MSPFDLFQRANEVLVAQSVQGLFPSWEVALAAVAIQPDLPTTRAEATPQFLLQPPFKDDPELRAVAFYVGIGFIEVRQIGTTFGYQTTSLGGDGVEKRNAFLVAARELFYSDVGFRQEAQA
jgi:hypothetical protein